MKGNEVQDDVLGVKSLDDEVLDGSRIDDRGIGDGMLDDEALDERVLEALEDDNQSNKPKRSASLFLLTQ